MPPKKPVKKTAKPAAKPAKPSVSSSASITAKKPSRGKKKPQLLRGMKDILPQEQPYWEYVQEAAAQASRAYGYDRIDLPVLEERQLFERTIGEATDIIEKEMYTFTTKGEDEVSMRPEFTAGAVRAYIEHGMLNLPQPVKLWTHGPLFRYDRPQAGRYRQFHQVDWEIMGSDQSALDAELISLGYNLLSGLGLNVVVLMNSIGTAETRKEYVAALRDYLKPHKRNLDEDSQRRLAKNPLRILDSKEEQTLAILEDAPQIIDHLDDESREHFMSVLEYLDESDIPYRLQPKLVRGLDYYSRTTFEFVLETEKEAPAPTALIGGGRYDGLIQQLGGPEGTPAVGMAMGIERVILAIKESGIEVGQALKPDVYFAQIGETARKRALKLFEDLRKAEIAVASNISKNRLSDQLSLANKAEAKITLILGQKEMIDSTIIVRDMEAGSQETIDQSKLIPELKKRLKK
jgi:histidyl-tRNA synthetase